MDYGNIRKGTMIFVKEDERYNMDILKNGWESLLKKEFEQPYYLQLQQFLMEEYHTKVIYLNKTTSMRHWTLPRLPTRKWSSWGQDPYHQPNQAHGLSFSVKPGGSIPPSFKNIFKELQTDLAYSIPNNSYLVKWAQQGVLMLNALLTVRAGSPNSHKGKGWEIFTDKVISLLNNREQPVVFILWGNRAQEKLGS
jgi:uracil-DNA glycosylase